jgi:amino acid transporter
MVTSARSASGGSVLKRFLVGRAFASQRMEHTLLPKVLALPVFASDALSSVAYATGEIIIALALMTSRWQPYVMPISLAIAALMAVVVSSYRQTVRAYPGGGGAYIVSKDNLGTLPGLVAAAALLFDYMMTVVVSIVAGVFAIVSTYPSIRDHAVALSIAFVLLVTLANLRGARESGTLFAIPTYGFIASILTLVGVGLFRCLGGCPTLTVEVEAFGDAARVAGTVGVFAILKAFSQGATALTGVEAISNGVPAFRHPQAKNAATTLAVMGTIAIMMFLGISFLATHVHGVVPSEERSIVAQIALAVFGGGGGFFIVQFFTAAILILAANTAYQDFPRLASILGRDRFMPVAFVNRGDRLVFSNGVLVLGALSCLMIYIYDAHLDSLIHLYVVGVFTSFTLSQSGMVRHWLQEGGRGPGATRGWRRSIVINAVGAVTTAVVLLVVILSKFLDGAWLSILIITLLVPAFHAIHRHYEWVRAQLRRGRVSPRHVGRTHVVLLVRARDEATAEALGYIRATRPASVHAIQPVRSGAVAAEEKASWRAFAGRGIELETIAMRGDDLLGAVRQYVKGVARDPGGYIAVVVPEVIDGGLLAYLLRRRELVRLKALLLREADVVVTDVPVVRSIEVPAEPRPLIPTRTVALVFVNDVNDATIRAVNFARATGATETRAVFFDVDPELAHSIERDWFDAGLDIPLDIVEAPFRDLTAPMLQEVRRYTSRADTVVNVVLPEFIVSHWWQVPLHNQNALFVKRLFLFEERVILSAVPFALRDRASAAAPASSARAS